MQGAVSVVAPCAVLSTGLVGYDDQLVSSLAPIPAKAVILVAVQKIGRMKGLNAPVKLEAMTLPIRRAG